jgi:heme b synthase
LPDGKTVDTNRLSPQLRLVAWEMTKRCNLFCAHCRAGAEDIGYENELSRDECFALVDGIEAAGTPILILTGGEPLLHPNVFEIGGHATSRGLRVVLGTNGTLITRDVADSLKKVPVARVGVSLDFPTRDLQDDFRGKAGAFEAAVAGIEECRRAGIEVQINSTITRLNALHLDDLLALALELGAVAFHPFMLVPTGRGKELADVELPPEEYERILNWVFDRQADLGGRISFKPTDAPHYMRIARQRGKETGHAHSPTGAMNVATRGCLAGVGFAFISHVGRVQGCGYLDVEAGNVREEGFPRIWADSPVFGELRDLSKIKGKCGSCEYKGVCGGCRARAYEMTGDYLGPEPYCVHQPVSMPDRGTKV